MSSPEKNRSSRSRLKPQRQKRISSIPEPEIQVLPVELGTTYIRILDGFKIIKKLSEGSFGVVYLLQKQNEPDRVIKFQVLPINSPLNEITLNELNLLLEIDTYKNSVCPKIYNVDVYEYNGNNIYIYTMQRVDNNLLSYLSKNELSRVSENIIHTELKRILRFLCKHNLLYADMHLGNIGITVNDDNQINKLYLFDWGWGGKVEKCDPCLELTRLYQGIFRLKLVSNIIKLERIILMLWADVCSVQDIVSYNEHREEFWMNNYLEKSERHEYLKNIHDMFFK